MIKWIKNWVANRKAEKERKQRLEAKLKKLKEQDPFIYD